MAAVLGEHQFMTNLDLWQNKVHGNDSQMDLDHLAFGRDVENAIGNLYGRRTGRPVEFVPDFEVTIHPDIPWLGATLDRRTVIDGKEGALELKHVGGHGVNLEEWKEDPPAMYQVQLQIQLACAQLEIGALAGMLPGYQLADKDFDYSPEFFDVIFERIDEFWNYNVKKKIPPKLIEHKKGLESVKRVYHDEDGETVVLPSECLILANELVDIKEEIKHLNGLKEGKETALREALGHATFGALNDGTYLSLKTTRRKGYSVGPKEFRVLRRTRKL